MVSRSQSGAIAILTILLTSGTVAAVRAQQASSTGPQTPTRANLRKPDDAAQVTGTVAQVNCADRWQFDLDTPSGKLHLHESPTARVKILSSAGEPIMGMPCDSLKGVRVIARYKATDSTIETLELLGSDPSATAGPLRGSPAAASPAPGASNPAVKGLAGDQVTAEGKVTDVTCTGNEILIKVSVRDGQLWLHGRDYTRLTYDDDRTAVEKQDFPACTDLKGRTASIMYVVMEHRAYDGELQSIEIEK